MDLKLLLEEARRERERCLSGSLASVSNTYLGANIDALSLSSSRVTAYPSLLEEAAHVRGTGYRRPCENASVQTDDYYYDPFENLPPPRAAAPGTRALNSVAFGPGMNVSSSKSWSEADEAAQAEAIQTIQKLAKNVHPVPVDTGQVVRSFADEAREVSQRAQACEQVSCLESELDGKEAVIQVLERKLAQRDAELQKAQHDIRRLSMQREVDRSSAMPGVSEYDRVRVLRRQVLELEGQLDEKDMQILRLSSGVGRHHRGAFADEESTLCGGSDKSEDLWSTAPSSAVWRS